MNANDAVRLSPTRVELGKSCYRKHLFSDMLRVEPEGGESSIHLFYGNAVHAFAAEWWGNDPNTPDPTKAFPLAEKEMVGAPEHAKLTVEELQKVCAKYIMESNMAGSLPMGEWEIKEIEKRFVIDIGDYQLSSQFDRVLSNKEDPSRLAIIDTKTAAYFSKSWMEQWDLNLQQMLYRIAALDTFSLPDKPVTIYSHQIEGVRKTIPGPRAADQSIIVYKELPEYTATQLTEAVFAFIEIAENDKVLMETAALESYRVHGETEAWPKGAIDLDVLTELVVIHPGFNWGYCGSYGSTCAFLPVCSAPPEERMALMEDYVTHDKRW